MTWTYSGDPSASSRDAVRFLLRDTSGSTAVATLADEEIAWLLTENGDNVYFAAVDAAGELGAKYASLVQTKTVGSLSITYASRAQSFKDLAKSLKDRAGAHTTIKPFSGGISKADKSDNRSDDDWNQPNFSIGMDDYPGITYVPNSTEF